VLEAASEEALTMLQEKLNPGGHGGLKHEGQPARSSRPGEYPAYQTGALYRSLGIRRRKLERSVGVVKNTPVEALLLEFRPPSSGGRPWLSKALREPELKRRMLAAVRRL